MKPLIIIEGPDATGKTTLSHSLVRLTNGVYLHGASLGDDPARLKNDEIMMRYHMNLVETVQNTLERHAVIMDRFWLSHIVYSGHGMTLAAVQRYRDAFTLALEKYRPFYVFALDAACVENHRKHQDPDHPYNDQRVENILTGFTREYHRWSHVRVARYDYTHHAIEEVDLYAKEILLRAKS